MSELASEPMTQRAPAGVWWLVLKQELVEMWAGRRALVFLTLFSVLMSITAFLLATNNELNLLSVKQAVVVSLTSAITFGLFIGLVMGAESISGERERATLEPLLLTPTSHRQIVLGKFLAALSPWPVALLVSVPYVVTLARQDPVLGQGLFWGAVMGTLLSLTFVGFGVLISIWSDSSRVSLFVCLLAYAALLIPAQLPTEFLNSPAGVAISAVDPLEAAGQLLTKIVGDARPVSDVWIYVVAPTAVTVLILGVLFGVAARRLRLTSSE